MGKSFDCRINWWRNSSCFKPKMPELVYANLDEVGRSEADEEIQDLLQGSQGLIWRFIIYQEL
jgi:hypothetical protein